MPPGRRKSVPLLAFALLLATAPLRPAAAATTCSATISSFDFGVIPMTSDSTVIGTVEVTCSTPGSLLASYDVVVAYCLSIGSGSGGSEPSLSPRWMRNSGNEVLAFDLAKDPSWLVTAGSSSSAGTTPVEGTLTYRTAILLQPTVRTAVHQVHGRVPAQLGIAAGSYQSSFSGNHTELIYRYSETGNMPSCSSGGTLGSARQAPFVVTARADPECSLIAADLLDFGTVSGLPGPAVTASAGISMTCRPGTAWQMSLGDGQNALGQTRRMSNGSGGYAQYELYRDAAMTQRFGQTPNADWQSGIGTGSTQTVQVYGRMPASQNLTPGSYGDRVVVTVTY